MLQTLPAGFARPVFESQSAFRTILEAMSRPGRIVPMPVTAEGPRGWSSSLAALVLTLCDMDTSLWLCPRLCTDEARRFVRFHCSSPLTSDPGKASFAVLADPGVMAAPEPTLAQFAQGSAEYPETSTTLILDAPAIGLPGDGSVGRSLRLQGPGIEKGAELPAHWLPAGFAEQWPLNAALFPCGVDVILAGRDGIVGLPRTVRMERVPCM